MVITYEELRKLKDSLPHGSMQTIASNLGLDVETVRNYFGGYNFRKGQPTDVHYEQGPGGGVVRIDDERVIEIARSLMGKNAVLQ